MLGPESALPLSRYASVSSTRCPIMRQFICDLTRKGKLIVLTAGPMLAIALLGPRGYKVCWIMSLVVPGSCAEEASPCRISFKTAW
jgi:hypothetical protein